MHLLNKNNSNPRTNSYEGFVFKAFASLILIGLVVSSFAQNSFKGEIVGGQGRSYYLGEVFGESSRVIDTIKPNHKGQFTFELDKEAPKGLYRLFFTEESFIDIILGFENVEVSMIAARPTESYKVIVGEQNKLLQEFYSILDANGATQPILESFVETYPVEDPALKAVKKQLKKQFDEEQKALEKIGNSHGDDFVYKYLNFTYGITWDDYNTKNLIELARTKDWTDTMLLNSDAYSKGIVDVLMAFGKRNAERAEQEFLFQMAVDTIFTIIPKNTKIADYAMLYLLQGFEQFEMENVIMHLVKMYSESCSESDDKVHKRLSFYRKFHNGALLPDFALSDMDGEPHQLYNESGKYTLVMFWATWCQHCQEMIDELIQIYPQLQQLDVDIISVSLDDKPSELMSYLNKKKLPWAVWTDYQSWDSPVSKDLNLFATPTLFLINQDHQIIGKPLNLNQLFFMVNQL